MAKTARRVLSRIEPDRHTQLGADLRLLEQTKLRKKLNTEQKRHLKSAELSMFVRQYARKAHPQRDPNDRRYDRRIAAKIRQLSPEELDALLRDGKRDE